MVGSDKWDVYFVYQVLCDLIEFIVGYYCCNCWDLGFVLVNICIDDGCVGCFDFLGEMFYFFLIVVVVYQVEYRQLVNDDKIGLYCFLGMVYDFNWEMDMVFVGAILFVGLFIGFGNDKLIDEVVF